MKEGRHSLSVKSKFLTMRVVWSWDNLAREAIDVPALTVSKASTKLDEAGPVEGVSR